MRRKEKSMVSEDNLKKSLESLDGLIRQIGLEHVKASAVVLATLMQISDEIHKELGTKRPL
jgi:hypothetical protein